ncbi:hypothetical protein KVR01_003327 [Diaporthe batatas]|uniref:uncharacterized protein n=1 Tax=Diaporthe batatas TaxID=748121 RepID=UPI001D053EF3|nr:uncharacterized protein KVR01_003327 [Diaporthe batatas]KAG8167638.1 hypothetical protein KVR01_003327 [Diaporthe batatas]
MVFFFTMDTVKSYKTSFEDLSVAGDDAERTLLGAHATALAKPHRRSKSTLALKLLAGVTALICAGAVLYTAIAVHNIPQVSRADYGDCGKQDSIEEARAKGCVFDPMGWVWVRPECYDKELVQEFMNRTDYSWHTEPKLHADSMVPLDVVFRGDHPKLFTQKKYHYIHCTVSFLHQ